jgi:hypothetical protein
MAGGAKRILRIDPSELLGGQMTMVVRRNEKQAAHNSMIRWHYVIGRTEAEQIGQGLG